MSVQRTVRTVSMEERLTNRKEGLSTQYMVVNISPDHCYGASTHSILDLFSWRLLLLFYRLKN